jgi:hypothetical protein
VTVVGLNRQNSRCSPTICPATRSGCSWPTTARGQEPDYRARSCVAPFTRRPRDSVELPAHRPGCTRTCGAGSGQLYEPRTTRSTRSSPTVAKGCKWRASDGGPGMLVRVSGAAQRVQRTDSHHGRAAGPETRQAAATWQVARACTRAKSCETDSDPAKSSACTWTVRVHVVCKRVCAVFPRHSLRLRPLDRSRSLKNVRDCIRISRNSVRY